MSDKWHEMLDHLVNKNEDKAKEAFQDILNVEKETFMAQEDEEDDTIEIKVNKFIPLAGDSGYEEVENLKQVKVDWVVVQNPYQQGGYMDGKEDGGLRDVKVQHDGPWAIYGDSGFEKAISKIVGFEVSFTEQGLQQDGQADMEGFMKNKGVKEDQSMSFEQMDKILINCCQFVM